MSHWYEVYEDPGVLQHTRRRAARYLTQFAMLSGIAISAGPIGALYAPQAGLWVALTALTVLTVGAALLYVRMSALGRIVWCVKLSVYDLTGIDHSRRQTTLSWAHVERVDVDREGILVVGRDAGGLRHLRVPAAFPDFARLGHRVVEYAEAHGRGVWIDGRPWQLLDLDAAYPFLRDELTRVV